MLEALSKPTLGHLDPQFLAIMDELRAMLRTVFGTRNETTLPMSGTGSAGMETCLVNLIEPGDAVLVGVHGVFGMRLAEVARRAKAGGGTFVWWTAKPGNEAANATYARLGSFSEPLVAHAVFDDAFEALVAAGEKHQPPG